MLILSQNVLAETHHRSVVEYMHRKLPGVKSGCNDLNLFWINVSFGPID